jgi:phage gp36-like protein
MSYATQADLVTRYGEREILQATDKANPPAGAIDAATVAGALADADALVDSYLGNRYAVPLATTPARVVDLACVIARYRLHEARATDRMRRDYEDAIAFLRDVAAGRAMLPGVSEPTVATEDGLATAAAVVRAPEVWFTADVLEVMP